VAWNSQELRLTVVPSTDSAIFVGPPKQPQPFSFVDNVIAIDTFNGARSSLRAALEFHDRVHLSKRLFTSQTLGISSI